MNRMLYVVPDRSGIGNVSAGNSAGFIMVNGSEISTCGKDAVNVEAYTASGALAASGKDFLTLPSKGVYVIRARFSDGSVEVRKATVR